MTNLVRILDALASFEGEAQSWLVGTPCFEPPEALMKGLEEAARLKPVAYGPPGGSLPLREAVAELHRREGEKVGAENIVITPGAKAGILVVLASLVEAGDEVLIPTPGYPAYTGTTKTLHAVPVPVEQKGKSFDGWVERLTARLSSRSRLVVVSSPSNPTGATFDKRQMRQLVQVAGESELTVVLDEAYRSFVFSPGGAEWHCDPEAQSSVVVVRSFSKSYALCGLRLGYVVAPASMTEKLIKRQSALLNPPNTVAQMAAQYVLDVPASFAEDTKAQVQSRLEELAEVLTRVGLKAEVPQGGFYLWVDVRQALKDGNCDSSLVWCETLARDYGVGLWPGEDFGSPGWVRFSAVAPRPESWQNSIERLSSRLAHFLD